MAVPRGMCHKWRRVLPSAMPLHVCIHVQYYMYSTYARLHYDLVTFSTPPPPRLLHTPRCGCQPLSACMHVGESRNAFDSNCLCTAVVSMYPLYVHQYLCAVIMRSRADRYYVAAGGLTAERLRWIERALFEILPVCAALVDCIASSRCGSGVVQAADGEETGYTRCMGCTTNRCCHLEFLRCEIVQDVEVRFVDRRYTC
jgi:hypothetical protein